MESKDVQEEPESPPQTPQERFEGVVRNVLAVPKDKIAEYKEQHKSTRGLKPRKVAAK